MKAGRSADSAEQRTEMPHAILFFDGLCGICNGFVNFALRRDHAGRLRYSPLQGETARDELDAADREALDTVVLKLGERSHRRSSAVVRVLWSLGPLWRVLGTLMWIIPLPLRDLGYRVIAKNRYRLAGKRSTCRIPSAEERARFLD